MIEVIVAKNGTKRYYLNKVLHRDDGPAIEHVDGDSMWFFNGELHREDGPAIEFSNGNKQWWFNGKLHREDGPAIELAGGGIEWALNNIYYATKEEWFSDLSEESKLNALFIPYFLNN
jgi:hypothetical protein